MILHYLKVAWRNLIRHRLYSFINIGGLSIGVSACLLILLFVIHEHSYDKFHRHAGQIYSMYSRIKIGGDTMQFPGMSQSAAPLIMKADPSVVGALRILSGNQKKPVYALASPEKKFGESHFIFADSNFFRFFSFHLREGNPDQVLRKPFTVVISEEMAQKYFGKDDPVGKLLRYDSAYTFEITGVADKAPSNSSLSIDFVASLSSQALISPLPVEGNEIMFGNYTTYLQLREGAKPQQVEAGLQRLATQNVVYKDMPVRFVVYPLTDSHLEANFTGGSDARYLSVFPLVAGLILLLALINYMNLSTARATLRAREVGVRKANGASRGRIAGQFYVESTLYALIAFVLGWALFRLAQPYFFRMIGVTIDAAFIYQPRVLAVFTGLLLITILAAGAYPSIVLSSFNPVVVLYGRLSRQSGGAGLRKSLTVLQFFVSVVLTICSLVIGKQLYFFRHTETGVNRENVVTVPFSRNMGSHYQDFEREVARLPGVSGVAAARYALYRGWDMNDAKGQGAGKPVSLNNLTVDPTFIPLLGIQWKVKPSGPILASDHQIVINESAIGKLGLPPNPMGQEVHMGDGQAYTVAGVVKDFNYNSLHAQIGGLCLFIRQDSLATGKDIQHGVLFARIASGVNLPATIDAIRKIYESRDISSPFEFEFMDDAFNSRYQAEDKLAGILDVFTGLTILIACLGLFGLAAFSASRRSKEISIRKVLGAGVENIILLLTRDFIKLVLISILLAIPVAWWLLHRWLENFAYKVSIGWTVFLLAGASAVLIALLTVGMEALRAAIANPVNGLRSE